MAETLRAVRRGNAKMEMHDVAKRVRKYLSDSPALAEWQAEIQEDRMRRDQDEEGDFWYLAVQLRNEPPRRYEYYDELTAVENQLKEKEHLSVLLIPTN